MVGISAVNEASHLYHGAYSQQLQNDHWKYQSMIWTAKARILT